MKERTLNQRIGDSLDSISKSIKEIIADMRKGRAQPMPGEITFYCPNNCGKTVIELDNGDAECLICGAVFEPYDRIETRS